MNIQVWSLTPFGKALARSTTNPRTTSWSIIHYLDNGAKTPEQIADYINVNTAEVSVLLRKLSLGRQPIVVEINRSEVA